ncbi:winged helix-turn-helix domain-containing protein [Streptomyces sp. MST-110588]|uniref:winged helix-turn-helix domain-containing protein n=1 Tax=Streptomyces sp. MST-110588 TaxID=2833628 RepID=UPI001F5D8488|nr:winged helix-turn-helix domain-containing protein [Streptomyces sp. MST-110588]UNO42464.1 winged helix-turn-helix transcriptional regulator [Streptomyces sp. MST-110588]
MTNVRSLPATTAATAATAAGTATTTASAVPAPHRQRLRAVAPDEAPPVAELLTADATWLPAPQHALPVLPGRPPMVGYLVLVPAERVTGVRPVPGAGPATTAGGPAAGDGRTAEARDTPAGIGTSADRTPLDGISADGAFGDEVVRVDPDQRTVRVRGRLLDLTYLEFELLAHLVAHPYQVHTRDRLVTTVWGYGHVGDGRTVDVHVARLRRKLGAQVRDSIVTVRRVGYKYVPAV